MNVPIHKCDLCFKEHRSGDFWWNNPNGGVFTVCRDGVNGKLEWEHLCPDCRTVLCTAIELACEEIRLHRRPMYEKVQP